MTDGSGFFLITQKYKRFVEFCESCRKSNYIGLCYGKPGVGKTQSARQFTQWQIIEPLLGKPVCNREIPSQLLTSKVGFYTPDVVASAKRVQSGVLLLRNKFDALIEQSTAFHAPAGWAASLHKQHMELLIVDEAERLGYQALEQLRDFYDRSKLAIILMGAPVLERKVQRYPQLRDRIGFVYELEALNAEETRLFINQKWLQLNLPLMVDDPVSAAIARITGGNLRRLHRIFAEIERLQKLNCFPVITLDVIETARQSLLPGTT